MWTSNTMLSYTRQTMLSKGRYYHSAGLQVTRNLVTRLSFLKMENQFSENCGYVQTRSNYGWRAAIGECRGDHLHIVPKLPNQYLLCLWTYLISLVHQKTTSDINISFFFPEEEFSGIAPCKFRKRKSNPTSFPGFSLLLRERTVGLAT